MIKKIIEDVLNIPVLDEPNPLLPPHATYMDYFIMPGLYGNGTEKEEVRQCQVDLWCIDRKSVYQYSLKLKKALFSSGAVGISIEISVDPVTKLWRSILKFEYQVKEEKLDG